MSRPPQEGQCTCPNKEIDVRKLQAQVAHLTDVVGVLSAAFDQMSQSHAIVSNTVNHLVQTQEYVVQAVNNNSSELLDIKSGIAELLKRLPPPSK